MQCQFVRQKFFVNIIFHRSIYFLCFKCLCEIDMIAKCCQRDTTKVYTIIILVYEFKCYSRHSGCSYIKPATQLLHLKWLAVYLYNICKQNVNSLRKIYVIATAFMCMHTRLNVFLPKHPVVIIIIYTEQAETRIFIYISQIYFILKDRFCNKLYYATNSMFILSYFIFCFKRFIILPLYA